MDEIARGLVAALVTILAIGAPITKYFLTRLTRLEKQAETRHAQDIKDKNAQIAVLEARISTLEEQAKKVPALERQVATLFRQIDEQTTRIDGLTDDLGKAQKENQRLRTRNDELLAENTRLFEANKALTVKTATYRSALALFADKVGEKADKPAPEPGESVAPAPDTKPNSEQEGSHEPN
jgi:chromosome segregation ATPase